MENWITESHESATTWPKFDREAEDEVLKVLHSGNVSTHEVIRELEDDYMAYTGRKYALAHNNGTSALMAAFYALELEPGDEVLVPTATFWASVSPMIWNGLVPVFCESEPETLGIDPEDMKKKITSRTKAVVIVHLWGLPCKVEQIREICQKHDLKIIEDAAHAHGASCNGEKCGSIGDISVFSLQGDKLAPAGEGGVLLTDSYDYWEKAVCFGDITRIIELETQQQRFAATSFGIKTRMAPLSAALGKVMLKQLDDNNDKREQSHQWLSENLEQLGFDCFLPGKGVKRVWFEFMIRHRDPDFHTDKLLQIFQQHQCPIDRPRYPLLHNQPFYNEEVMKRIGRYPDQINIPDYASQRFPVTEKETLRMIKLPNFCNWNQTLLEQYLEAFKKGLKSL